MAARTGYLFHELFMWHHPGMPGSTRNGLQHVQHFENEETKRRLNNLIHVSGMIDQVEPVKPRPATLEELQRVHDASYVQYISDQSRDSSKGVHKVGDDVAIAPGGFEIAALAAGGGIALVDAALDGRITNGYALLRPPGHHAEAGRGMGFCVFNNVAVAAAHALEVRGLQRIAVVDYDVHHGNGTQQMFWEEDRVLLVSLHQDSNYPLHSGPVTDLGAGVGEGFTLNVPLPPGSGSGAYRSAFDQVVSPALDAFQPQLILVSSGFDAAFLDPLSSQMLSSEDYRYFTKVMMAAAERHCQGRLLGFHEGGYSEIYVPFCGLAVLEQLSGFRTPVKDVLLKDVQNWGYQDCQPWQQQVIEKVREGPLELLKSKMGAKASL